MVRSLALAVLPLGVLFSPTRAASTDPHLVVMPAEAHPGGALYLSGAGFPAHHRLTLRVSCLARPHRSGPGVDARGQFMAYRLTVPSTARRSARRCAVSVRSTTRHRSTVASARFTLLPASRPLARCAVRMCLGITAILVRVRHGVQGNIVVKGWPGARVAVSVSLPGRKAMERKARLDWRGSAPLRLRVAPTLKQALRARVDVSARLGGTTGNASKRFSVLPGSR